MRQPFQDFFSGGLKATSAALPITVVFATKQSCKTPQ
jgi:hypothetical protein